MNIPEIGDLINTDGIPSHYGIVVHLNPPMVISYTGPSFQRKDEAIVKIEPLEKFAGSRMYRVSKPNTSVDRQIIVARAFSEVGKHEGEYSVPLFNCETWARGVAENNPVSFQVWGGLAVLAVLGLALAPNE